jgi:hypothetical protein
MKHIHSMTAFPRTGVPTPAISSSPVPQHSPLLCPTAICSGTPEIDPQRLGFGFLAQNRRPCAFRRTGVPTPAISWSPAPQHSPLLCPTAICSGTPETEPRRLDFGFQAQIPPACLRDPTQHHHTVITSYTTLYHLHHLPKPQFATVHLQPSPGGSISGFRHKYHLPACVTQRSTTTPPPPRTHHPTTSPYRPRQPFLATYP